MCVCAACPPGLYGALCSLRCDCMNSAPCDPATGHCICPAGYNGNRCHQGQPITACVCDVCVLLLSVCSPPQCVYVEPLVLAAPRAVTVRSTASVTQRLDGVCVLQGRQGPDVTRVTRTHRLHMFAIQARHRAHSQSQLWPPWT